MKHQNISEEIKELTEPQKKSVYEFILFLTFKEKLTQLKKIINLLET
jgi:hypothetical protein